MRLLELRYRKLPIVDKIMSVVDDIAVGGGNEMKAKVLTKYGIDPMEPPEKVRRDIIIMDEFKVMQLYRALMGGK